MSTITSCPHGNSWAIQTGSDLATLEGRGEKIGGTDIDFAPHRTMGASQRQLFSDTGDRVGCAQPVDPLSVTFVYSEHLGTDRRKGEARWSVARAQIAHRLAPFRHIRIEINECRNAIRHLVRYTRHDHPAI